MTLEVVAKKAHVPTATVSRVLNGAGVVRESTRKRARTEGMAANYPSFIATYSPCRFSSLRLGEVVSYHGFWGAIRFGYKLAIPFSLTAAAKFEFRGGTWRALAEGPDVAETLEN
jgi:hypothetical protein